MIRNIEFSRRLFSTVENQFPSFLGPILGLLSLRNTANCRNGGVNWIKFIDSSKMCLLLSFDVQCILLSLSWQYILL